MAERFVFDRASFAAEAAVEIGRTIHRISAAHQDPSIALTGGRTAGPVYEHLAALRSVSLHWKTMSFYFGDERAVAPDHRDSNFRLVHETLLARVPVAPERVHRMEADRADLDRAARDYDALLPPALDLILLGMGSDGHIASLFPGSLAMAETVRRVVPVFGGTPPIARLTITPPVLEQAREIIVMVSGAAKREAAVRALEGPFDPTACPAQLVRGATWILDHAAAEGLSPASGNPDGRLTNPGWRS